LTEADVGARFVAISYGVRDLANAAGERTMGNIALTTTLGQPGVPLLASYEALFSTDGTNVQPCSGDSGGPLLRKVDGALQVHGVASWVLAKGGSAPCGGGVVYATFGESAKQLIDSALADGGVPPDSGVPDSGNAPDSGLANACGDVPVEDRCEAVVAVRCIATSEAPLSRLDWATLLKRTFSCDVRVCPRCGGGMKIRAVVTDPASIAKLLTALRRPRAPPVAA
jgi:hypothetical protein